MPLVRCSFRGLPPESRKGFLFEKVLDAKGRRYEIPVAVGVIGSSRETYSIAMMSSIDRLHHRWMQALQNPIDPVLVADAPCQEAVHTGNEITGENGGFGMLPIPLSTPGFDPAPFLTATLWITKDPETGIRNVGLYKGQIKSPNRVGVGISPQKGIGIHWIKCKKLGIPLQAAGVIGPVPAVAMCGPAKVPNDVDELRVAGGIAGEPIKLVKCKTVDIEVPATAEIVLEGEFSTEFSEPMEPFGDYAGYMSERRKRPFFTLKAITHRQNPIYHAFISQMPPSEATLIRGISYEANLLKFLKYDAGIGAVKNVAFHDSGGTTQYVVIQLRKLHPGQSWQALNGVVTYDSAIGKFIIAVDDDINPWDPDAVNWALSFRVQPHLDTRVVQGRLASLDPSSAPPDAPTEERRYPKPRGASSILIDATRKWDYPPTSLPTKEYMDKAVEIWNELKLPPLTLREPWFGYNLGDWTPENDEDADLAVRGEYYKTGERMSKQREKAKLG